MVKPITLTKFAHSGRAKRASAFRAAAAFVFLLLAVTDVVTPAGRPLTPFTGVLSYAIKTGLGLLIVLSGFYAFLNTKLPVTFRASIMSYISVVAVWFAIWLIGDTRGDAVTYLANPFFSVWSWMMVLAIPLTVWLNRQGVSMNLLPKTVVPLLIVCLAILAYGQVRYDWRVNLSSTSVGVAFLIVCRQRRGMPSRLRASALILTVSLIMLSVDSRIYALGFLFLSLSYVLVRRFNRYFLILSTFFFMCSPLTYSLAKDGLASLNPSSAKVLQDTRTFLFTELFDDLSDEEVITGRGLTGTYYSPYFAYITSHQSSVTGYNNIERASSEVAWLNIILKFGLVGLIPFLMTTFLPVAYNDAHGISSVDMDGVRRLTSTMTLIFAAELPNQISLSYLCWFMCIGLVIANSFRRPARMEM